MVKSCCAGAMLTQLLLANAKTAQDFDCSAFECTCQGFADWYAAEVDKTWGCAGSDAKAWSKSQNCDAECHNQGTGCNSTQAHHRGCEVDCDPFGCTCQGFVDWYGAEVGKTWGCASKEAQAWSTAEDCDAECHSKGTGCTPASSEHGGCSPSPSPSPSPGPFKTARKQYTVEGMDSTSNKVDVWYPTDTSQQFPFISYSHGNTAGGSKVVADYGVLLSTMASYGYIIAAHESCDTGCKTDTASDPLPDPPRFKNMYNEQLKVVDWAKTQGAGGDAVLSKANFGIGVGIAGHSMGGQATMKSSSSLGAGHGIKAAVMHHAYTHVYPAPTVPFLAFTGSADTIATPAQTQRFYNAKGANPTKAYVNKKGSTHFEPNNPAGAVNLGIYSAAWFKIFLDETPQSGGVDFHEMIFGEGADSLCHGGDGAMTACEVHDGTDTLQSIAV